ncbi:MAG: hypothetical protein EOS54_04000 [Mesorhizobium sp.]|uniref:hypothetical protein n=1 Tax=unclassified Mesorhizobium TaxID=325217 RepID=UPI000F755309|nr:MULTISPECIES: hypothetical protein [unclassified Mesorhizobium]RVC81771.1 hypothetical protein EN766_02565 [Mesorhizobium sp. M2A.F.Ca.ET.046.02.1.1]AZO33554.1 hypothetical protein EJ072_02750 [Mesorhizobium sp. M2A.F.Ca.ET.046.03.2.1]RWB42768.1 MAG: hypothetical protein EOQ44_20295 [Mesorhizobium sp.]RWC57904.1 MAG: hypothetical protein EOS54_04000 [Mesorhizobium sp.]RWE22014.1 MAG: hypothetical protein EOS76_02885 [Mesorhizobium sp.]
MKSPLHRPDDSNQMQRAIKRLVSNGYGVSRKSPHQLKVGPYNFYPDRGTITQDGEKRIELKGIDHFIALLEECKAAVGLKVPGRHKERKPT